MQNIGIYTHRGDDTRATYRMLLAGSAIGIWEYIVSSGQFNLDETCFSLLGQETEDLLPDGQPNPGLSWMNLLHPDDLVAACEGFQRFLTGQEQTYEGLFRLRHAGGSWLWLWSRGQFTNEGRPGGRVIGTCIDISQQKQQEQSILQDRVLLRTLIDNLPDIIYVKDSLAHKIIANMADVRALGGSTEADVLGKTDLELFGAGEIAARGYADDLKVLQTGVPILNKEEFFTEADNSIRWLLTSKIPVLNPDGQVVNLIGIGHDITLRKQRDEALAHLNKELQQKAADLQFLNEQLQLQKEQELEKALALGKFEIASEILHDIGNALVGFGAHLTRINRANDQLTNDPLHGLTKFLFAHAQQFEQVIGNTKSAALVQLSERLLSAQQLHKTEIGAATKEIFHIVAHIQDILNIQRQFVRNHEGLHERKPADMQSILADCRSMIQSAIGRRGIELKTAIPPGQCLFKGDHTRIMQVVLNILKNAMEAITADAVEKTIRLSLQTEAGELELNIRDSGAGFDEATGAHLCERGFTTKANGTGLGLYNCRSIIESHRGRFSITSEGPGKGALVNIKLPLFDMSGLKSG